MASSAVSLIVALIFLWVPMPFLDDDLIKAIPVVFFGASFAGMSSKEVMKDIRYVALAGLVFGFIFTHTSTLFTGYGGGLGTTACISVIATYGIANLIEHFLSSQSLSKITDPLQQNKISKNRFLSK